MTDAAAPTDATPRTIDYDKTPAPRRSFTLPLPGVWVFLACLLLALLCNAGGLRGVHYIGAERELVLNNDLLNRLPGLQMIWFRATDPVTYPLPQYAPLAQTLFFLEHAIWGDTLWAYRLTSVLLHAGVGVMIWLLLRRLALPVALLTAMLFVAHPATVDSVSWLAERRNPLAAILALSAAYLLLRASGVIAPGTGKLKLLPDDPIRLFGMGVIFFILALCSNAALVATLPLVVLLIAWWKRDPAAKPDVRLTTTCIGLLMAGIAMLMLTSSIEKARAGVSSPAAWNRASGDAGELAVRAQIAGRAVVFYAQKLVVPFPVAIDYPRWQTPRDVEQFRTFTEDRERAASRKPDVAPGNVVAYLFPLAAIAALCASWLLRKRLGRGQFLAVAAFMLLLAPMLGFIDLGWMRYSFVSNRALYLASIPFLAAVAYLGRTLTGYAEDRTVTVTTAVIAVGICTVLSLIVSLRLRDAANFWIRNIAANPSSRSWWPRYELASVLLSEPNKFAVDRAVQEIDILRKIRPDEPGPLVMRGLLKQRKGDEIGALADFEASMQTFPAYAPAYFEAADSFRVEADRRQKDPKPRLTALQLYAEAAARDPLDARARLQLGQTSWQIALRLDPADPSVPKYIDQAAEAFDQAIQLRPYNVDLLVTIARTLVDMRKLSDAGGLLESARSIAPERPDVYIVIADASLLVQDRIGADAALRAAIHYEPKSVAALLRLATLRQSMERWTDARQIFNRVLEIDPENAAAKRGISEVDQAATTRPGT